MDDDGHLVSYVSTAGDLIPGQSGPPGVENVFIWLRQTNANILASGQDGSPSITGSDDSNGPLLTRHSFPGFSSKARLLGGPGGSSVAYINTLVQLVLTGNTVADGSQPGSLVGLLKISSLLVGQYVPPVYSLVAGSNLAFALGGESLLTRFLASYSTQQSYQVTVHFNIGFGETDATILVYVAPSVVPPPPDPHNPQSARPLSAQLVTAKVGKKKKTTKLLVRVFYADTGEKKEEFLSPYQKLAFTNIRVSVRDGNGDGVPDQVVLTAKKGKKKVTAIH
jgi:hypothetical protein